MKAGIILSLFLILSLAVFFRLNDLEKFFGFYGDQGQDLLAVNKWLEGGPIPIRGILTSIGNFHMPPLYYYLITPFVLLFGKEPISPVYLFFICGVLLTVISFFFLYKSTDFATAFLGSILIASSPHTIFISMGATVQICKY